MENKVKGEKKKRGSLGNRREIGCV